MSDIGNQQIFQLLTEVRDDVKATAATVNKLEIHVEGNGGKGLLQRQDADEQRLDTLEEWKGKRPEVCPATAKEILKGLARGISIATAVLGLLIALSVFGSGYLRKDKMQEVKEELEQVRDLVEKLSPD